ncbi:hypothetical protein Btru_041622 [Bulinus truncatus]|nr:hypothetical protein Btru_041622 [Bulinus truncatus]
MLPDCTLRQGARDQEYYIRNQKRFENDPVQGRTDDLIAAVDRLRAVSRQLWSQRRRENSREADHHHAQAVSATVIDGHHSSDSETS